MSDSKLNIQVAKGPNDEIGLGFLRDVEVGYVHKHLLLKLVGNLHSPNDSNTLTLSKASIAISTKEAMKLLGTLQAIQKQFDLEVDYPDLDVNTTPQGHA